MGLAPGSWCLLGTFVFMFFGHVLLIGNFRVVWEHFDILQIELGEDTHRDFFQRYYYHVVILKYLSLVLFNISVDVSINIKYSK